MQKDKKYSFLGWLSLLCLLIMPGLVGCGNEAEPEGPIEITVAGIYVDYDIQDAARDFNASQDQYVVKIEEYYDRSAYDDYSDVIELLQRNVALDSSGIDLVCLNNLNVSAMADAGAFEDLNPFLDNGESIRREDLFESILNSFIMGGKLIAIPRDFTMWCMVGRTEDLGDRTEWTLREMLDFAKEHPEQKLFQTGDVVMLRFYTAAEDLFIKEQDGKIAFDAEECRDYLKLLKSLQDAEWKIEDSPMLRLQNREALLDYHCFITDFYDIQYMNAVFGTDELTYMGLPASSGIGIRIEAKLCAMSSQSDCKEGAWAFLEFYLSKEQQDINLLSIPMNKELFELKAQDYLTPIGYAYDADGNVMYDESGRPIPAEVRKQESGSWEYTFTDGKPEEVEVLRELIERGGTVENFTQDYITINMILSEETPPYFSGEKDLDEVVDIIGNCWLLYWQEKE